MVFMRAGMPMLTSRLPCLLFGMSAGTFALYDGAAWLLPYFGLLSSSFTFALCLACGTLLGLRMAQDPR